MTIDRNKTGFVFNIQKYSVHDGPGIRTIIFLKGCSLRCAWCSNPESQKLEPQVGCNRDKCLGEDKCTRCVGVCDYEALGFAQDGKVVRLADKCQECGACVEACPTDAMFHYGYEMSVKEALDKVEEDSVFYSRSGGGLTLSGGEPLFQQDFVLALLREAKKRRLNTCIETCGQMPWEVYKEAAQYLNSMFYDVKHMDPEKHKEQTGANNELILSNLRKLREEYPNLEITVRTPIVPGFNDTKEEIEAIAAHVKPLGCKYEVLQYHRMGSPKYTYLGMEYPLDCEETLDKDKFLELKAVAEATLGK